MSALFNAVKPAHRVKGLTERRLIIWMYLLLYTVSAAVLLQVTGAISPVVAVLAGAIYLLSHVFRGMRLAALSVDALNLSARTTAALHFTTAPFALLIPFKLGEFIRFFALYKLTGKAAHAAIVLLLDRMFDSLFLVPFLIVLIVQSEPSIVLTTFTILAATVPLTLICIGPRILAEIQRYVVASKNTPLSLNSLKWVDILRRFLTHAASVAWRQGPQLCVLSVLIWLCELILCIILVMNAPAIFQAAIDLLGARLLGFWTEADAVLGLAVALSMTLMTQLLIWPFMALFVLDRLKSAQRSEVHSQQYSLEGRP